MQDHKEIYSGTPFMKATFMDVTRSDNQMPTAVMSQSPSPSEAANRFYGPATGDVERA